MPDRNQTTLEGTLTSWNDERGFGRIESRHGGEPIFVHVSVWPRGAGRPRIGQAVTFEVEMGPKGKRAKSVQLIAVRRTPQRSARTTPAQWGTASLLAIPAWVVLYAVIAALWKPPLWVAGLYAALSVATFAAYAADKAAAASGNWRTPENTLHLLALAGGWPGALLAQQVLRHKSSKPAFRRVFWMTVVLNVAALVILATPLRRLLLQ